MTQRTRTRFAFGLLLAALWFVGLEVAARTYWWLDKDVDPFAFDGLIRAFYPELRDAKQSRTNDQRYDLLLLGASALNFASRSITERLERELERPVRVHNIALPSHSTLDSLYKYQSIPDDRRFDLVVVYHGINDVRANNVPAEFFQADYSHYSWYAAVNALFEHPEHRFVNFPYTLRVLSLSVTELIGLRLVVPQHVPRDEWLEFGAEVKTSAPFRSNLEGILELSRERGERLAIMSFATFVPPDYSEKKFKAGELAYTPTERASPIEIWGRGEHVLAGVAAHNEVIREVVAAAPDVLFIDQENLIPKDGMYFVDVCHFSEEGLEVFADHLVTAVFSGPGIVRPEP